jgi:phenylpropionate dioxygenase-like ring-hydroxylating dioxygenase large terminal subunit
MTDTGAATIGDTFEIPGLPLGIDRTEGSDALAPLIFNAWYVIAVAKDVDRSLKSIKVLGQPLVYYRTEAGEPVVLDDRCLHRRFPLSKGKLVGDTIACGYHGFTYDKAGQCIWAPGVPLTKDHQAKLPFGVRAYPCAERGPWLWAWMGEPEKATAAEIPLPDLGAGQTVTGYKLNPANYMMLIENLLDLSHLHFLHGAADLEHAGTLPKDVAGPRNGVKWRKIVERTEQGIVALHHGGNPDQVVRQTQEVTQFGPSLTFGYTQADALPGDPPPTPAVSTIAHALTPRDARSTHQFFCLTVSDPFVTPVEDVLAVVEDIVFEQDVQAVHGVQANVDEDNRPGRVEVSMAGDRWGIKMRRILKDMKAKELGEA